MFRPISGHRQCQSLSLKHNEEVKYIMLVLHNILKFMSTEGVNINPSSDLQPDICRRNINTITNNLSFIRTYGFHGQRLLFVLSDSHRNEARRKLSC